MKTVVIGTLAFAIICLSACRKEVSFEHPGNYTPPPVLPPTPPQPPPDPAEVIQQELAGNSYQLRDFYSDIPIDLDESDDEVRSETELWVYVAPHLKDDVNTFDEITSTVVIEQHTNQAPGITEPVFTRSYQVGTDSEGIYFRFLDHEYNPLEYRLHEVTDTYFILAFPWKGGATLFSRFERIN